MILCKTITKKGSLIIPKERICKSYSLIKKLVVANLSIKEMKNYKSKKMNFQKKRDRVCSREVQFLQVNLVVNYRILILKTVVLKLKEEKNLKRRLKEG